MNDNIILIPDKEGGTLLGALTPFGVIPITTFSSFGELRRFAMGILGYVEHFHSEIPEVYIKAFEDKEESNGN